MNRFSFFPVTMLLLAVSISAGQENGSRQSDSRLPAIFRDVKLTDAQRQQIKSVTEKFREPLTEVGREQNGIFSSEQQQARREAVRKARDQGKSFQEARQLIDVAVKVSPAQEAKLAAVEKKRREIQQSMQAAYLEILTPQQRKQTGARDRNRGGRANRIAPTHPDVSYGPHERNVMDVWIAESGKPTPVLFAIHGGGFRGGNKSVDGGLLQACLDNGISVVAITYRLSGEAIAPAQFHDSARAIQFVRHKSDEWNFDKSRFASSGGSAGAGLSLWLAFHNDMADSENSDPVLRESTRLSCAIVFNGQTTYDPRVIEKLIPEADTCQESALEQLYDVDLSNGPSGIPPEKFQLIEEVSPINHLSQDDVPVLLAYASALDTAITSRGIGIHHPRFGDFLQKKMEPLGIECVVKTKSRRGSDEWVEQTMAFLKKHL